MEAIGDVVKFLGEHVDIIQLISTAITSGVDKDTLMSLIRASMVTASDLEMKREFPNG